MSSSGEEYTISITKNQPGTETICLEFSNGEDTKSLDITIQACELDYPGITISRFDHNQTAAAFSTLPQKFTFDSFVEGCGNHINYRVGTESSTARIPEGLTGEVISEECGLMTCISVISEAQIS